MSIPSCFIPASKPAQWFIDEYKAAYLRANGPERAAALSLRNVGGWFYISVRGGVEQAYRQAFLQGAVARLLARPEYKPE